MYGGGGDVDGGGDGIVIVLGECESGVGMMGVG